MSRSKTGIIFLTTLAVFLSSAVYAGEPVAFKPFMLFVTKLTPPPATLSSPAFTERTANILRSHYDTTSYQVIVVDDTAHAFSMSNHKRDIIISSDPTDFYRKGTQQDTAVVWATFRTGFSLGRIEASFSPGDPSSLPLITAQKINDFLRAEFLGEVYFEGGPKGFSIEVVDNYSLHPPRLVLLPAGSFFIKSSFPGFRDRLDTLNIPRGDFTRKRILLIPN